MKFDPLYTYNLVLISVYIVISFLSIYLPLYLQQLSRFGAVILCVVCIIILIYYDNSKSKQHVEVRV